MRKIWLVSLIAGSGLLVTSLASAQPVTFAFRSHEVENPSKAVTTNAPLNEYAQFGIMSFAQNLANDYNNNLCQVQSFVKPTFKSAVVPLLKGAAQAGFLGGEQMFGDGTITLDFTRGVIDGGVITTGGYSAQSNGKSSLVPIDYEDLGTQSLVCGGASTASGAGTCGAACTSAKPNCVGDGGTLKVTGSSGMASGYTELFIYPLANTPEGLALCQGNPTLTWAECCGDPKLVIVRHVHTTLSTDHTRFFGTTTDEEAAGSFEGQQ